MRYSGVGGQAVMEGVMMRNGDRYAVAVRKPDHEIEVKSFDYKLNPALNMMRQVPVLRGVVSFIDSLYLGMGSLMYSASFFEDEEEEAGKPSAKSAEEKKKENDLMMTGTVIFSVAMAVGIFFMLPYFLSDLMRRFIHNEMVVAALEGVLRLVIFIGYIVAISFMEDIKRTFMYHGAEHKCINCIEHGLPLTVDNVRASSKEHKRCGTSFLIIVMLISIVFFMFIRVDSRLLRLGLRIVLIPVIAGVSFEFLRLAGRYDNWLINLLSKPGLLMQGLTTKEPDDEMIEVGIASVEAIFDWKKWQEENGLI